MINLNRRGLVAAGVGLGLGLGAGSATAQGVSRFTGRQAGVGVADHAAFDALLSRRARDSRDGVVRVDYAGWRGSAADRAALVGYIDTLSALDPLSLTRPEQFAYWANLYNALTIRVVVDEWPVRSIRDIRSSLLVAGPWRKTVARVGGVDLSLDDIEHEILRKGWSDPRVHYAVNCASFGCPNLPLRAWRGEGLGPALDVAARSYVNHPRGVTFNGVTLTVSSIYKWYAADFGGTDARVIAHLTQYAAAPLAARLRQTNRISGETYNWAINATTGR